MHLAGAGSVHAFDVYRGTSVRTGGSRTATFGLNQIELGSLQRIIYSS
jgi:hypothetical protein